MTKDDIIRMAREVEWLHEYDSTTGFVAEAAFKFAALVASAEREACAKLIETTDLGGISSDPKLQNFIAALLFGYAQAIRARGQA